MKTVRKEFPDVTGAILVGGRSRRFGSDKVLLTVDGRSLAARTAELVAPLTGETILVGHHRKAFEALGCPVLEDAVPDAGPLGGIFTALAGTATPFVLVLASDMPFLSRPLIRAVLRRRREADAVIPRGPKGLEPLCAVYSRSCVDFFRGGLERGTRRIVEALEGANLLTPRMGRAGEDPDPFYNINYPGDSDLLGKI